MNASATSVNNALFDLLRSNQYTMPSPDCGTSRSSLLSNGSLPQQHPDTNFIAYVCNRELLGSSVNAQVH